MDTNDTKKTSLVLPREVYIWLKTAAATQDKPQTAVIIDALKLHLGAAAMMPHQIVPAPEAQAVCAWDDDEPATCWVPEGGVLLPSCGDPGHEEESS